MDLFRHQRLKRVRARWVADTDSHSVANAIGQKLDKLMERLDKVGTQVTTSVKKAAVIAPGAAPASRAMDQALVDAMNRINGRLESLETRLTDVTNELVADVPSVDDVVASIKSSELGSDILWIKKAISKVYKEMKSGDGRSAMVSDAASAFVQQPPPQLSKLQPTKGSVKSAPVRRELA
jgi:tetrahydromethanopterin S-methyltransferase subunit G